METVTKDLLMNIGKIRKATADVPSIGVVTLVEMSANRVIQLQQLMERYERENAQYREKEETGGSWESEETPVKQFTVSQELELLVFIVSQMVAEEDGTLMFADEKGREQLKSLQKSVLTDIGEVCWQQFNQWTVELDADAEKS